MKKIYNKLFLILLCAHPVLYGIGDESFYQAALSGGKEDLETLAGHFNRYSFKKLKEILRGEKTGTRLYYNPDLDEYASGIEHEPVSKIIEKLPPSSAHLLAILIKKQIHDEIKERENIGLGLGEIPWLKNELELLEQWVKR